MKNTDEKLAESPCILRTRHNNKGSSFDSFLREEGILEEATSIAAERVASLQKHKKVKICD
jgi:hypothetical protein